MENEPTNDEVEALIERFDGADWCVDDWSYAAGRYKQPEVKLTLQWDPQLPDGVTQADVAEVIKTLDGDSDPGVHVEAISDYLHASDAAIRSAIEDLAQAGEIYQPTDGRWRVT